MPRSRQRQKRSTRRYQLTPQRKTRTKSSPKWFGPLVLGLMGIGLAVIVWNYIFRPQASNGTMFLGLGFIAVGFIGTTFWK